MVSPEMRHMSWVLAALLILMTAGRGMPGAQAAASDEVAGEWRITKAVPAPWATRDEVDRRAMRKRVGQGVLFESTRIHARAPLGCGRANYESVRLPSRGLFQGGHGFARHLLQRDPVLASPCILNLRRRHAIGDLVPERALAVRQSRNIGVLQRELKTRSGHWPEWHRCASARGSNCSPATIAAIRCRPRRGIHHRA